MFVVTVLAVVAGVAHAAAPAPLATAAPSPIGPAHTDETEAEAADPARPDDASADADDFAPAGLEAPLARGALLGDLDLADLVDPTATSDDLATAFTDAGGAEAYESLLRRQRPSRIGRIDLSLLWRHTWSDPRTLAAYERDTVWLVATWRR